MMMICGRWFHNHEKNAALFCSLKGNVTSGKKKTKPNHQQNILLQFLQCRMGFGTEHSCCTSSYSIIHPLGLKIRFVTNLSEQPLNLLFAKFPSPRVQTISLWRRGLSLPYCYQICIRSGLWTFIRFLSFSKLCG